MGTIEDSRQHLPEAAPPIDTLPGLIETHALNAPGAVALLAIDGRARSFRELCDDVRQIATGLHGHGLRRADSVAIVLPNGPDAALAFFGVASTAIAAPLNPAYSQDEFAFYLKDLNARALVVDAHTSSAALEAARSLNIRIIPLEALRSAHQAGVVSAPRSDDVALVLHTSGTTSRPKIVPLTHANLVASAHTIATSLDLTPTDRCLNVMPLFHVHGLIGAVLATLAAGGSVIATPGFDAATFFTSLEALGPTWYTAVPTMHQAILAHLQTGAIVSATARLRFARSCSSALAPKLMSDLEAALRVPVVEAYGMTEASHQMACNPQPPRARKPGSVGVATGVEIAIMNENGQLLSTGDVGEIVIRGQTVTKGYSSPVEANATAFTNGWFRTGDQGRIDSEGYVFITGRLKEIINRGGEKVSPREIDEALLQHPAVAQAVAFAVPHATLGEDIAAVITLRPGVLVATEAIREHAFARLAAFKVPSEIIITESIPKGPTGKVQRIGLHEKLRSQLTGSFLAPGTEIEVLIASIWSAVLGVERIGTNDNFFALGGDSLRGTRVVSRLNDLFALELRVTALFRKPTVKQLAELVTGVVDPARVSDIAHALPVVRRLTDAQAAHLLDNSGSP